MKQSGNWTKFSDVTELSLEGRYDKEKRSVNNNVPGVASALYYGGGAPINPAMAAVGDSIPSREKSFDQFQPKISLTTSAENTTVYASVSSAVELQVQWC